MAAQLEESLMAGPLKDICSALFTPTLSAIAEGQCYPVSDLSLG
jgi:hypothetical protein